jgi:allene oxide cyclase
MTMQNRVFFVAISLLAAPAAYAAPATLVFVERATTDTVSVHAGKAADTIGDILTFTNDVFDAGNTKKLGYDQGYCVRLAVGKAWECHWSLMLGDGQIAVDGPFLDAGDSMLAVTGGTGAYSGARGEMTLHARDAKGSAYDFTYALK